MKWFGYTAISVERKGAFCLFIWRLYLPSPHLEEGEEGVSTLWSVQGVTVHINRFAVITPKHSPLQTSVSWLLTTHSDSFGNFLDSTFLHMYVPPPGQSFSQAGQDADQVRPSSLWHLSAYLQVYYRPVATTFAAWPAAPICLEMPASHEGHSTWKIKCIFLAVKYKVVHGIRRED